MVDKGELCDKCGRYNSRHITTDIVLLQDNMILLVLRNKDPEKGKWALPGGYLEWNETLEECAVRELYEETGYKAKGIKFFKVYSDPKRDGGIENVSSVFVCTKAIKESNLDKDEVKETRWFRLGDLPKLAFDHKKIIEEYIHL